MKRKSIYVYEDPSLIT